MMTLKTAFAVGLVWAGIFCGLVPALPAQTPPAAADAYFSAVLRADNSLSVEAAFTIPRRTPAIFWLVPTNSHRGPLSEST